MEKKWSKAPNRTVNLPCLRSFVKINSTWISELNMKTKNIRKYKRNTFIWSFERGTIYIYLTHGAPQVARVIKNLPAHAGDVRDMGLIPGLGRSPGVGSGNPLQYSRLEDPMDREAWWDIVHGVAKSQTQLSTHTKLKCGWCSMYVLEFPVQDLLLSPYSFMCW